MDITILINLVYLVLALVTYFSLNPEMFVKHSERIVNFAVMLNFLFFGWHFGVEEVRSELMDSFLATKNLISPQLFEAVFSEIEPKRLNYMIPFASIILISGLVYSLQARAKKILSAGS